MAGAVVGGDGGPALSAQFNKPVAIAMDAAGSGADLYFLRCTAIRVFDVIVDLERDLGAPVLTSNQAMTWWCLREAGLQDRIPALGRLFS